MNVVHTSFFYEETHFYSEINTSNVESYKNSLLSTITVVQTVIQTRILPIVIRYDLGLM